jgi:hypothetical protein
VKVRPRDTLMSASGLGFNRSRRRFMDPQLIEVLDLKITLLLPGH